MAKTKTHKRSKLLPWRKVAITDSSHIPKARTLIADTLEFIGDNIKVIGVMTLIYGVFYIGLIALQSTVNLSETKDVFNDLFGEQNAFATTLTLTGVALGSAVSNSQIAGATSVLLLILFSLAFIWAIRHLSADKKKPIKIRDPFYKGMTALIPYFLLLILLTIELLPFAFTGSLYANAKAGGLLANFGEELVFLGLWLAGSLLSGYLLTSTAMALYAVTLPDVYPWQALRVTNKVIKGLRGVVFRRMITLPLIMGAIGLIILLLTIRFIPSAGIWVLNSMIIISLPILHIYMYKLYRSLV